MDAHVQQLQDPDWLKRIEAARAIAKGRPRPCDVPALRKALSDPVDGVAECAAHALGKVRPAPLDAVDDLIAAATAPWKIGCPQLFCDAISSLVKIAPNDERLVPVIQAAIRCSNYGIQKAAVMALVRIGSPDAIETIKNIDRYWGTGRRSARFDRRMNKVLAKIS